MNKKTWQALLLPPGLDENKKLIGFSLQSWRTAWDCLFLGIIVFVSAILYLHTLGFYSDDWAFLSTFHFANNQSLAGLYQAINSPAGEASQRPLQILYYSILYKSFGLNPLGYHIVNTSILAIVAILFYLVLRHIAIPRFLSLAIALTYILLPNYSSDRFWFAAFETNFSMAFYLGSLYAGLRSVYGKNHVLIWESLSIICLVISLLCYEVVLPLFLLNIALFWIYSNKLRKEENKKHAYIFTIGTTVALGLVTISKAFISTRLSHGPLTDLMHYPEYILSTYFFAVWKNFGSLGLKLPYVDWVIITRYFNWEICIMSLIVGVIIYSYFYKMIVHAKDDFIDHSMYAKLMTWGVITFFLGYAIFLVNNNIGFTTSGIGNRVGNAAGIGVAFITVGIIVYLSGFAKRKYFTVIFCILIALFSASSFLILNTVALFWAHAYVQEKAILSDIQRNVAVIAPDHTLLLDGICPYVGPAVVFESNWDLSGALRLLYHEPTLQADIVTPRLTVMSNKIETEIYSKRKSYRYSRLSVYNYTDKHVSPITSYTTAFLFPNT